MLILRPSNSGLKEIINIQKFRSSTKVEGSEIEGKLMGNFLDL